MSQALRDAARALLAIWNEPDLNINNDRDMDRMEAALDALKGAFDSVAVIPVTEESSGSDGEQAHTMSMCASREDMERARFEEGCSRIGRNTKRFLGVGDYVDTEVDFGFECWMAALKGQK